MAILVPDVGEVKMLTVILTDQGNWTVKLFQSNTTPANSDIPSTYTEATFDGYSSINVTVASWGAASSVSGIATAVGPSFTFTYTSGSTPNDIYGWYIIDASGNLMMVERFAGAPLTMAVTGDQITVTPTLRLTTA